MNNSDRELMEGLDDWADLRMPVKRKKIPDAEIEEKKKKGKEELDAILKKIELEERAASYRGLIIKRADGFKMFAIPPATIDGPEAFADWLYYRVIRYVNGGETAKNFDAMIAGLVKSKRPDKMDEVSKALTDKKQYIESEKQRRINTIDASPEVPGYIDTTEPVEDVKGPMDGDINTTEQDAQEFRDIMKKIEFEEKVRAMNRPTEASMNYRKEIVKRALSLLIYK